MEIRKIIRRWQAGLSQRRIASGTGLSRVTVRRYVEAAEAAGLTAGGPEPSEEQLAALATLSLSGPRRTALSQFWPVWNEFGTNRERLELSWNAAGTFCERLIAG